MKCMRCSNEGIESYKKEGDRILITSFCYRCGKYMTAYEDELE